MGLIAVLEARLAEPATLEEVLTGDDWFGLPASPLQRALCRWADGLAVDHEALDGWLRETGRHYAPDVAERMTLAWVLGGDGVRVTQRPTEIVLLAGIRTGKTKFAEALMVARSQSVDMTRLDPAEYVIAHTVSLKLQLARVAIMHLHAAGARPCIQERIVGSTEPDRFPPDGLTLRHPSGREVRLQVSHGGRAGGGLVATWVSGVTFDEAGRMVGEEDGVINLDHARSAVVQRLLDGAQIVYPTSPWAPIGPIHRMVTEHHGRPGDVLVVRAPAPALWPGEWTPEKCERARERARREVNDDSYRMDVLGEWGTPETAMFGDVELAAVMRRGELEPVVGEHYYAAMDPASRGNAWTLVIGGVRRETGKATMYSARQWIPGDGLSIGDVVREVAELCRRYRCDLVRTDQWAADAIAELGRAVGLTVIDEAWTAANKVDAFDGLRIAVRERQVELVAAANLRDDLLRVRRVLTGSGVSIRLPETSDGRHCDYAPAVAMWARVAMDQPAPLACSDTALDVALRIEAEAEAAEDRPEVTGWRQRRADRARS